jgi:hypothetical protein
MLPTIFSTVECPFYLLTTSSTILLKTAARESNNSPRLVYALRFDVFSDWFDSRQTDIAPTKTLAALLTG